MTRGSSQADMLHSSGGSIHHVSIRGRASLCAKPNDCNRHAQHHLVTLTSMIFPNKRRGHLVNSTNCVRPTWVYLKSAVSLHHLADLKLEPGRLLLSLSFLVAITYCGLLRLAIPLLHPDNDLHERICTCKTADEQQYWGP